MHDYNSHIKYTNEEHDIECYKNKKHSTIVTIQRIESILHCYNLVQ